MFLKNNTNSGICLISSCWGDSHQMNKIIEFEKNNIEVKTLAYVRQDYYKSETNRHFIKITDLKSRHYLKRIWTYIFAFFKILKNIKNEKVVYVFGIDNIIITILIKIIFRLKLKLIYEIPDIREVQFSNSIFTKALYQLEKVLYKKIDLFVFTSEAYYTEFYEKILGYPVNYTVIENKINTSIINEFKATNIQKYRASKPSLTIGYFGLLRCSQSLKILIELAKKRSDFNIILRGIFMENTRHYLKKINEIKNINYLGAYVSPIDLRTIYEEIDISWICYPFSKQEVGNWKLAKTNRFYESGFYKTPMISSKGTQDSKKVDELNIGIVIDLSDLKKCLSKVEDVTLLQVLNWKKNIENSSDSNYVIKDDYRLVINFIKINIK